jgi:hypothetical protein
MSFLFDFLVKLRVQVFDSDPFLEGQRDRDQ